MLIERIIVICECYKDAQLAYGHFCRYIDKMTADILDVDIEFIPHCCEIIIDGNISYLFFDYHYMNMLEIGPIDNVVGVEEFLRDLDDDYHLYT